MISLIIIVFVAIEHLMFGYIEMFGSTQLQSKAFEFPESELKQEKLRIALANQGIYNIAYGLLLLGLLLIHASSAVLTLAMLFVILVGIYGSLTVTKKILFAQAFPAFLGLIALLLSP